MKLLNYAKEISNKYKISFRELELFLMYKLNTQRANIYINNLKKSLKEDIENFISLKKLAIPLQYITGTTEFMGIKLLTPKGIFIPRPETERLVEIALGLITKDSKVLEIGTGTGAISIAFAHFKNPTIEATDIYINAIKIAKINAHLNRIENIKFFHRDLFPSSTSTNKYDLIISNPPYIPNRELDNLMHAVALYEPYTALSGGKNGVEIINNIIKHGIKYLKEKGKILLEIDPANLPYIDPGNLHFKIIKDYNNLERYLIVNKNEDITV